MLASAAYHFNSLFCLDDRATMIFNMVKFNTTVGEAGHAMCCNIDLVFVHAHKIHTCFCVCALRHVSIWQNRVILHHMVTWCCFLLGSCRMFYRNSVSAKILTCFLLCMLVVSMCQAFLQTSWLRKGCSELYAQQLLILVVCLFFLVFVLQIHCCAL